MDPSNTYTAFAGERRIASGSIKTALMKTKESLDQGESDTILIFEDQTGKQVDFDLRGSEDEILARLATHPLFAATEAPNAARTGPGRPKLGVTSREVSLLPRHWDWLERQPSGISAALRRLVDDARKREPAQERARAAREAAGKFMWTMAGNLPQFEDATRALYAKDGKRLERLIQDWPKDIRDHLKRLVDAAVRFEAAGPVEEAPTA